jgi:hypothetical protein
MSVLFWAHAALLAGLSAYGVHRLVLLARLRNTPSEGVRDPDWRPAVTVQLPLFNERDVVERVIAHAAALDWPDLEIQVLDDSTDDTTQLAREAVLQARARGVDISLIHRTDRSGFKAGALEAGMARARGELIAVFDADFLPDPGFLRRTVPPLADPRVGMVQARWGHLNHDHSWLTRAQGVLLDGHFVIEHQARFASGCWFNFNGTAGIWRRRCIADAGGWEHDTLTEDLDLSYRALLAGWRFVYQVDHVVPAELPETLPAFRQQQHRWAKGSIQVARKLLGRIARAPIAPRIKLEAAVHLLANGAYPLVVLLAVLAPLAPLRTGPDAWVVQSIDAAALLAASLSVWVFYATAQLRGWSDGARRLWRIPVAMALGIGICVRQSRAVLQGLTGHTSPFVRTPKSGGQDGSYRASRRIPWAELTLGLWQVVGVGVAVHQGLWGSIPLQALLALGFGLVVWGELAPQGQAAAVRERAPTT